MPFRLVGGDFDVALCLGAGKRRLTSIACAGNRQFAEEQFRFGQQGLRPSTKSPDASALLGSHRLNALEQELFHLGCKPARIDGPAEPERAGGGVDAEIGVGSRTSLPIPPR